MPKIPNLERYIKRLFAFIARYQRILSTASTVVGFLMHIVIIKAIDLSLTEFILTAHLMIVSGATLIGALPTVGDKAHSFVTRTRSLMPLLYQYSTGALLSSFLILYSASGSLSASLPFLVILAIAAVGNEILRLEEQLLPFQTTLLTLNVLLYAALVVPIELKAVSATTFLIAVTLAVVAMGLFLVTLWFTARKNTREAAHTIVVGVVSTLVIMIFFYFGNVIPPIPLAAKDVGFYHEVAKVGDQYRVLDEPSSRFFDLGGETLHLGLGERAYFYSAIFAPAALGTDIVHRWQRYESASGTWATVQTVAFPILGGRDGGYRGYSFIDAPSDGTYRVSIETARGQVLGRFGVRVVRTLAPATTTVRMLK